MNRILCSGFGALPSHEEDATDANFARWALEPNRKTVRCRNCDREWRRARKGKGSTAPRVQTQDFSALKFAQPEADVAGIEITDEVVALSHEYVPDPELVALWKSVVEGTLQHGDPAANIIFFGPSGSGKTDGAAWLAGLVNLPFTKVDAASMTDPEAWFGSKEVEVEDGASVTRYRPSDFVQAIQRPGVVFIDEVNRVDDEHRNVLLPLTDGTGKVTNPLTGEIVLRHQHCFIIMAGNRGVQFTGTSAVDPAFTSRAYTVEFDYIPVEAERKVARDATGCDDDTAAVFVAFANETREKAKVDPDFTPISTREVIMACRRVARGLDRDLAAKFAVINAMSGEGGTASIRQELQSIWNGVRLTKAEVAAPGEWKCPTHGRSRHVPAGVSANGNPYLEFWACPEPMCEETSGWDDDADLSVIVCPECSHSNPPGRTSFCANCGAVLNP